MPTLLLLLALAGLAPALAAREPSAPAPAAAPTAAEIAVKIAALGVRDDIVPYEARPEVWLARHIDAVLPAVIAGMDNAEPRIRNGCLDALTKAPPADTIRAALLRAAESAEHPLAGPALVALCRYAADAHVKEVLTKGITDARRLPKPEDRAKLAEAVGDRAAAVALLLPVLEKEGDYDGEKLRIMQWLGRLNHASALPALKQQTKSKVWWTIAAAYLAMDQIETAKLRLTPDQKTFLQQAERRPKEREDSLRIRGQELAELKRAEIRPFVLQMLVSDQPDMALTILLAWQDREAIPEIQRAYVTPESPRRGEPAFIIAWLRLLPDDAGVAAVAAQFKPGECPDNSLLGCVAQSEVAPARKLVFFRELRNGACHDEPLGLAQIRVPEAELGSVLVPLLRAETDVAAVALLAGGLAESDRQHRFGAEIATALGKVLAAQREQWPESGQVTELLKVLARAGDPAVAQAVRPLLTDQTAPLAVRLAAAQMLARCGVDRAAALQVLCAALGAAEPPKAQQATEALAALPCRDDAERAARETLALGYLGKPGEVNALRVLATCAGAETARQLAPLLDDEDAGRALLAAWVLAQSSDKAARTKGLRRLAIYAMFNYYYAQQSEGFGFQVAPGVSFGQTTRDSRRSAEKEPDDGRPRLPPELLEPFTLDAAEQAFSVRAYHHALRDTYPWKSALGRDLWALKRRGNATYAPLLEAMAMEDPRLEVLHVAGAVVAHFPTRKAAAEALAQATGKPASYRGLDGALIASDAFPQAYPDQNARLAAYLLDRVQAAGPIVRPESERDPDRYSRLEEPMQRNVDRERFGAGLRTALRAEAERRGIAAQLKAAGYALWRTEP